MPQSQSSRLTIWWGHLKYKCQHTDILDMCFSCAVGVFALVFASQFFSWIEGYADKEITFNIYKIFTIVLIPTVVSVLSLRYAMKLNIAISTNLKSAIEFGHTMETLGIYEYDEQIRFAGKRNLRLYTAAKPIYYKTADNVRAKLYSNLGDHAVVKRLLGEKRLCCNVEEFEQLVREHKEALSRVENVAVRELKQQVSALEVALAQKVEEVEELRAAKASLENAVNTQPAREKRSENLQIARIPFWRVAGGLLNAMIADAPPQGYTRSEIQARFTAEVQKYPELHEAIRELLQGSKPSGTGTDFTLPDWAMEALRTGLGKHAKTTPGANRKR